MALPLDDTISGGQAGHIADHQTIAAVLNVIDTATSGDVMTSNGSTLVPVSKATLAGDTAFEDTYVESGDVRHIVVIGQAAYDALTPDAETLYVIDGA